MQHRHFDPARELRRRRNGRRVFGLLLLAGGIFMLLSMLNILPTTIRSVKVSGPIVLLAIGIFVTLRSGLRHPIGPIIVLIAVARLIPPFEVANGVYSNRLVWPIIIIVSGIYLLARKNGFSRPRRHSLGHSCTGMEKSTLHQHGNDMVDIDVTFGGRKEVVTSRFFKGGDVNSTFGGVELNLMQASMGTEPAILRIKSMFSGVEVIVPADWDIQNEIQPVMGTVEDHRYLRPATDVAVRQMLILRGSCTFGSVEIKSY